MGYETVLHLVDVKVKSDAIPVVMRILSNKKRKSLEKIRYFLDHAVVDDAGFLLFTAGEGIFTPYEANDGDGTVPAIVGKLYESDRFANWIKQYAEKGGRLVHHSHEG